MVTNEDINTDEDNKSDGTNDSMDISLVDSNASENKSVNYLLDKHERCLVLHYKKSINACGNPNYMRKATIDDKLNEI